MTNFIFSVVLCLIFAAAASCALEVGDDICVQGYIMDYFCIDNGDMIDNGKPTLEKPGDHSVHCLVDVGICLRTPFEVLTDPVNNSKFYERGYRLDDDSKEDLISLIRSVGSCGTCVNGYDSDMIEEGIRAVMTATVLDLNENDDDAPPLIRVKERKISNGLGSDPCQSEFGMPEGSPTDAPTDEPTQRPSTPPPTARPTSEPTSSPTPSPTASPTRKATPAPTAAPSASVTPAPTASPTIAPSPSPTSMPSSIATPAPTASPTIAPSASPVDLSTPAPTESPTIQSSSGSGAPSSSVSGSPSTTITLSPSAGGTNNDFITTPPSVSPTVTPQSNAPSLAPSLKDDGTGSGGDGTSEDDFSAATNGRHVLQPWSLLSVVALVGLQLR